MPPTAINAPIDDPYCSSCPLLQLIPPCAPTAVDAPTELMLLHSHLRNFLKKETHTQNKKGELWAFAYVSIIIHPIFMLDQWMDTCSLLHLLVHSKSM